jgi:hypothetical protein
MPPSRAIAIAISDSVTVSIAAEIKGTLSFISLVKRVVISTSLGRTDDFPGTRRISSNVNPTLIFSFSLMITSLF